MSVLKVRNVKKKYQTKSGIEANALTGVSFEVEKGEFVGIMGPSGAGKSTLLNIIATIDMPTSGDIEIGKENICGMHEPSLSDFRRSRLGFIFQDYNLLDTLTLEENIALPLVMSKEKAADIDKNVKTVAASLGIEKILEKYPCEVSGGQRQRASAARAMIHKPDLILADEPTGALDSKSAKDLLQCLQQLNEEQTATILCVTHDAFTASFCQRILLIKDGYLYKEITKNGTRKQFFDEIIDVFAELGGDSNDLC